jgi:hypothetical protein
VLHNTFIVTLQATGSKKLQALPSLFVLLDKDGQISKIITLKDEGGKSFTGAVHAVTIAKGIIWTCGDSEDTVLVGFRKRDVMDILGMPGIQHSVYVSLRAHVHVSPAVLHYDDAISFLWVGETQQASSSKDAKAIAYHVEADGNIQNDSAKAELVYGPNVRGMAFFTQLGRQYVAVTRCGIGMILCKIEFHNYSMPCASSSTQESISGCDPLQIHGKPAVWVLQNVTLMSAAAVPFGAEGLATDYIQGGYFLLLFSSATEEGALIAIKYAKDIEDSMFLFTAPILRNQAPVVKKNMVFCELLGSYVVQPRCFLTFVGGNCSSRASSNGQDQESLQRRHYGSTSVESSAPLFSRDKMSTREEKEDWADASSCMKGSYDLLPKQRMSFFNIEKVFPVSVFLVKVAFSVSGYIQIGVQGLVCLDQKAARAALLPNFGAHIDASGGLIVAIFEAGIQLGANILDTTLVPEVTAKMQSFVSAPLLRFRIRLEVLPLHINIDIYFQVWGCPAICNVDLGLFDFPFPCLTWCPRLNFRIWTFSAERWNIILFEVSSRNADNTPPKLGLVQVMQSRRESLQISWTGFKDEESGLSGYEVCMGSSEGKADYLACTNVGTSITYTTPVVRIPNGTQVFVTVKSYNTQNLDSSVSEPVVFINAPSLVSNIMIERTIDRTFVDRYSPVPEWLYKSACTIYHEYEGWLNKCVMVTLKRVPVQFQLSAPKHVPTLRLGYTIVLHDITNFTESAYLKYHSIGFEEGTQDSLIQFDVLLPDDLKEGIEYRIAILTENRLGIVSYFPSAVTFLYYRTEPDSSNVAAIASNSLDSEDYTTYVRPGVVFLRWEEFMDSSSILRYEFRSILGTNASVLEKQVFVPTFGLTRLGLLTYGSDFTDGTNIIMQVRATNMAGLQSMVAIQVVGDGQNPKCLGMPLDLSADSSDVSTDIDHTRHITAFRATWTCRDLTSGISKVMMGVGTQPYATNVIALTEMPIFAPVLELVKPQTLQLQNGLRYHLTVVVEDAVGLQTFGTSDGMIFDLSPPRCSGAFAPKDGPDPNVDLEYQSSTTELHATWKGAFDETSLELQARGQAQAILKGGRTLNVKALTIWMDFGTSRAADIALLHLRHAWHYRMAIQLKDQAGNQVTCLTSGVTVGMIVFKLWLVKCVSVSHAFFLSVIF